MTKFADMRLSAGSCIGRRFPGQSTDRKRGNAGGGEVRRNAGTAGSGAPRNEHFSSKRLTGRQRSVMLLCEPLSCGAVSLYKEREKDSKTPFAAFRHFSETCVSPASEKTQRKQGGGKRLARCASFASSQHSTFTRFCIENIDAPTRLPERFARAFLRSRRAEPCPELSFIQRPAAWRSRRACNGSIWRLLLFAGVEARRTSEDYEEAALPCSLYVVLASQKSRRDRRLNCRKRS